MAIQFAAPVVAVGAGLLGAKHKDNKYVRSAMGPLGNVLDKGVDPMVAPLDPGTNELIDARAKLAERSDSDFADAALQGADAGQGLMGSPDAFARSEGALGMYGGEDQSNAIQSRSQKYFDRQMNQMERGARTEAPMARANSLANTQEALMKAQGVQNNIQSRIYAAEQNKIAARNAVIGSLLQVAGTAAGAMFGGPAGAKAGGAAGGVVSPPSNFQSYSSDGNETMGVGGMNKAPMERMA